jgi:hypothetical protein
MALSGFLKGLGQQAGYIIDYKQQYDANQQQLELGKQQLQMNALTMQLQQQQLATKVEIGQDLSAQFRADGSAAGDLDKTTTIYQKEFTKLAGEGKLEDATRMMQLANQTEAASRQKKADVLEQHQQLQELTAAAALAYADNPTPEGAQELEKAYLASGGNAALIPKPGTPGYSAWAKGQATSSMDAAKKAEFLQKEMDLKATRDEKAAEAEDRAEEKKARDAETEAYRQMGLQLRRSELEARREAHADSQSRIRSDKEFTHAQVLNTKLQQVAKPVLEDRERISDVQGLLALDSAEGDQQARQALVATFGQFKGRATNKYYADNNTFGNVANRVTGFLSKHVVGKYSDKDRADLQHMLSEMQDKVIDPELQKMEDYQKQQAQNFGIDPELVGIQGDFNRTKPQAEAPAGAKPTAVPGVHALPNGVMLLNGKRYKKVGATWQEL